MQEINDTQRLDFLLNCGTVEWQGFTGGKKGDYYEMDIWNGGKCKSFEGKTHRECIDEAIKKCKR